MTTRGGPQGRSDPLRLPSLFLTCALVVVGCSTAGPTSTDAGSLQRPPALVGVWRQLSSSPIGGRSEYGATWTGSDVVVWGGVSWPTGQSSNQARPADGAAYSPDSDTWRAISPSPLSARR